MTNPAMTMMTIEDVEEDYDTGDDGSKSYVY